MNVRFSASSSSRTVRRASFSCFISWVNTWSTDARRCFRADRPTRPAWMKEPSRSSGRISTMFRRSGGAMSSCFRRRPTPAGTCGMSAGFAATGTTTGSHLPACGTAFTCSSASRSSWPWSRGILGFRTFGPSASVTLYFIYFRSDLFWRFFKSYKVFVNDHRYCEEIPPKADKFRGWCFIFL